MGWGGSGEEGSDERGNNDDATPVVPHGRPCRPTRSAWRARTLRAVQVRETSGAREGREEEGIAAAKASRACAARTRRGGRNRKRRRARRDAWRHGRTRKDLMWNWSAEVSARRLPLAMRTLSTDAAGEEPPLLPPMCSSCSLVTGRADPRQLAASCALPSPLSRPAASQRLGGFPPWTTTCPSHRFHRLPSPALVLLIKSTKKRTPFSATLWRTGSCPCTRVLWLCSPARC